MKAKGNSMATQGPIIPEDLLQEVVTYLKDRPWELVNPMMQRLIGAQQEYRAARFVAENRSPSGVSDDEADKPEKSQKGKETARTG